MSKIRAFGDIENKHTLYRREDCRKKFCQSLREHSKNITDFEKKKMLPLTKEEVKSYQNAEVCYIRGKRLLKSLLMIKIIKKFETIVILQVNIEVQHTVYVI